MTSACGKGTERILIKHNYTTTDISYNVVWFGILYIVGTKGFLSVTLLSTAYTDVTLHRMSVYQYQTFTWHREYK